MYCLICGRPEGHCSVYIHRLDERAAKLEAWREQMVNPIPAEDAPARETTAAAGPIPPGHKLAPGWEVRTENCNCTWNSHFRGYAPPGVEGDRCGRPGSYYYQGYATSCAAHAVELGALVKVEPPMAKPVHRSGTHFAEQPASAADELLADERAISDEAIRELATFEDVPLPGGQTAKMTRDDYEKMLGLMQPKQAAPAQGAPAEPLSALIRRMGATLSEKDMEDLADDVAAIETRSASAERKHLGAEQAADTANKALAYYKARLAAAERERDEAVAAERERAARTCEAMVVGGRAWTRDQEVAAEALIAAAKAIRGRPAPK